MKLILVGLIFLAQFAFALNPEEQQPDELFPSYFARLTRGGSFPGIYLKANNSFAEKFRVYIRKNFWMGPAQKVRDELTSKNYDLWFDVFRTPLPQKFIDLKSTFAAHILNFCNSAFDYEKSEWTKWPICVRRAFIEEVLFSQSSAQKLAALYGLDLQDVKNRTEILLLDKKSFEDKLREAGWSGPIYFRGATLPDPKNPKRRWILLNDDFLKQYTGFEYPVLQMLEIAGIANHELSHVMQDFLGQSLGLDIQVRSAEQALIIEGQAEYLSEESLKSTGLFFKLFAAEQAVEVVNREGNQAEFFPYSIGLPFVATLYRTQPNSYGVTVDLLKILGQNTDLADYLKTRYP